MSTVSNFQLITFDGQPSSSPTAHAENGDKNEEEKDRAENAGEEVAEGGDASAAAENNDEEFDEGEFLADEDSEEDDIVVTIGELKTNFQKQQPTGAGGAAVTGAGTGSKLELDGTPSYKGAPIYDIDLATMEDKPWRKPGADITDYFNYGFNEDTWNQYCERQKKLRSEFGNNQEAVNRALFNSISISTGHSNVQQQLSSISVGRQLVNITGGGGGDGKPLQKINKVVIDLSKPPPMMASHDSDNKLFGQPISTISTLTASLSSADGGIGGFNTPPLSSNPIPTTATPISNHSSLISVLDSSMSKQQQASSPLAQQQDFSKPPPTPLTDFSKPPPSMSSMVPSQHHHQQPPMTMAPPSQQAQPILSMASSAPAVAVSATPSSVQTSMPPPLSSVGGAPPSVGGNQGGVGASGLPPPSASLSLPIPTMSAIKCEAPPGVDEPEPPGVSTPPPGMSSVPSMNFNPNVPPPGLGIGVSPMNVPPPLMFSSLPHSQSYSSGPSGTGGNYGGGGYSRPMPLLSSGERRERDRRSRSRDREDRHFRRSRSPRDRKKASNRDRERSSATDVKDKSDREKERSSKKEKTRKRSRSISPSQSSSKKSKKSSHYN